MSVSEYTCPKCSASVVASNPAVPQWQSIETAPKHGEFLVWVPSTRLPWPAYMHRSDPFIYSNAHGILNDGDGPVATHWMPLPAPPKEQT